MENNAVTLTWLEVLISAMTGIIRRVVSFDRGLHCQLPNHVSGWDADINGAIAEYAFGKWSGIFWCPTVNTFKKPDVGHIQVRSTKHMDGHLLVRKTDSDNEAFVLMRGSNHVWQVAGWCRGADAKQEQYWRENTNNKYGGCYWVPDFDLEPMQTLIGDRQ